MPYDVENKPIDDPNRDERMREVKEQYKKDMEGRPSGRPMGYIFPKRIKSILNGESPNITVSVGGPKPVEEHKVGDTWEDADGKTWEKKDGYTICHGKHYEAFKEAREYLYGKKNCEKCNEVISSNLDRKFYRLKKRCFNCVIKEETYYKITGQYETYEKHIMFRNLLAFLKDSKDQLQHYIDTAPDKEIYFNDDGTMQKWDVDANAIRNKFGEELSWVMSEIEKIEKEIEALPSLVEAL